MKKSLLLCIPILLGALAVSAIAQQKLVLNANVPFAFSVGSSALPAGDYLIEVEDTHANITNVSTHQTVMTVLPPPSRSSARAQPGLEFRKYGERSFLAEVRSADITRGLTFSAAERNAVRAFNARPEKIDVAAHR